MKISSLLLSVGNRLKFGANWNQMTPPPPLLNHCFHQGSTFGSFKILLFYFYFDGVHIYFFKIYLAECFEAKYKDLVPSGQWTWAVI